MVKERIPNWFYDNVPNMTIAVMKEIISDAITAERKRLAEKIKAYTNGVDHKSDYIDSHDLEELANAIESEDS